MASFTDAITQFNPYVAQLPVEAMVKVGMQKQAQYEEGYKKIQSQIDQVAGLDLAKGVHKDYLQSKLNQLGKDLRWHAASDFSNFQTVNAVGGMAKQISTDNIVQGAVASTMKLRKEQARGEDLKKKGKSSANREFDFNNEASSWLNDGDLESSFNGEFKEHVDVNKKVIDILDKLHPNSRISDHPYAINEDGSVNYGRYAEIMQKQGLKGVDEGQIKTAVNAMLDANDYDELASQGRFNYRDYNETDLSNAATRDYTTTTKRFAGELDRLKKDLLTTNDIGQQNEINNSISYYQSMLGNEREPGILEETYQSTLKSITADPNKARSSLYTRNWLDQIANGFAYREVSDEVLTNPGRTDFWNMKDYEFKNLQEAHNQYWKKDESARGWAKVAIDRAAEERQAAKDRKEAGGGAYYVGSGDPTTDNLEAAANWSSHMAELSTENTGILDEIANSTAKPGIKADPNQVLLNIENYKKNQYKPSDDDEKALFDKYIQNSNNIVTQQKLHDDIEAKAYDKIAGAKTEKLAIDNTLKGIGSLSVTLPSGQKVAFSSKEVLEYLGKEYNYTDPEGITTLNIDESTLNDREKQIKKALRQRYFTGRVNSTVDSYLDKFNTLQVRNTTLKNKVNTQVANDLASLTGSFKTEQAAVTFKDNNEKNRFIGELTNLAGASLNIKVAGQNYTPKELIESLKNKNADDIEVQTIRKGNKYYLNVLDKKNPKDSQRMPVPESFVAANPSLGSSYLNQGLDLADQSLRNNKSTNIYQDYDHAYYHNGMFGGYNSNGQRTVSLPVVADIRVGSNGQFYPIFKMKTGNTYVTLKYPKATDYSTFQSIYLPSLNDDKILKLFKTQYPNIEQLISK